MTQVVSFSCLWQWPLARAHGGYKEAVGGAVGRSERGGIISLAQPPCLGLWNHSLTYCSAPSLGLLQSSTGSISFAVAPVDGCFRSAACLRAWVFAPSSDPWVPFLLHPLPCWLSSHSSLLCFQDQFTYRNEENSHHPHSHLPLLQRMLPGDLSFLTEIQSHAYIQQLIIQQCIRRNPSRRQMAQSYWATEKSLIKGLFANMGRG